jgi:outer membrane protein assembly factor BamB
MVYVTSDNAMLHAFDTSTGRRLWSVQVDPAPVTISAPTVAGGVAFATVNSRTLSAFDARTGASLWRTLDACPSAKVDTSPAIANGVAYVPCDLSLRSTLRWEARSCGAT